MPEDFIISIHIPKTAGTTLSTIYDRAFNRRVFYDYTGYENASGVSEAIKSNVGFILSQFAVMHGHFFASKYADVFPSAKYVSVLRHPVERIISQYIHELNEDSSTAWYHSSVSSGELDIVDFAGLPEIRNTMTTHLAGRDLKDFHLLMLTERMLESCLLFSKLVRPLDLEFCFGKPVRLPYVNQKLEREFRPIVSDDHRRAIFQRIPEDVETYSIAKEIFAGRIAAL